MDAAQTRGCHAPSGQIKLRLQPFEVHTWDPGKRFIDLPELSTINLYNGGHEFFPSLAGDLPHSPNLAFGF
jgi:hypothetical protein